MQRYSSLAQSVTIKYMGAIILFDGVCNFCDSTINYIIRNDEKGYFKFAALQSEIGQKLAQDHGIDTTSIDSVVLIEDGKAYAHSTAAVRIAAHLNGPLRFAAWLRVVPRPLRDLGYRIFARYRYRLFGKKDVCMMPTPEIRARFL